MNKLFHALLLILLSATVHAQIGSSENVLAYIGWRLGDVTRLLLCAGWYITGGLLSLVLIFSGLRFLSSEDMDERSMVKARILMAFVALIVVVVACPVVNYLVSGTDVKEFRCDCVQAPPPTTVTTTTRIPPVVTRTTSTKSTTSSTTSTFPPGVKVNGGRFLLVGISVYGSSSPITLPTFPGKPSDTRGFTPYSKGDIYGVIFNMDGSIYRTPFKIDNDQGPISLAVGPNRFLVVYNTYAVVLDWEGNEVKSVFSTPGGIPVKAIYSEEKFYVLMTEVSAGSSYISVYDLDGNLEKNMDLDIGAIPRTPVSGSSSIYGDLVIVPEGDMALSGDRFLITWYKQPDPQSPPASGGSVMGVGYDTEGNKLTEEFVIVQSPLPFCTHDSIEQYINTQVEAGELFLVESMGGIYLYDPLSLELVGQKSAKYRCSQDLVYGDGEYMSVTDNDATYYSESGDITGEAQFGGHADQFTHLAYGNKMYVGIVAIHMTGDGIGASFVDSSGTHLIDTMPLVMPEAPGYAAYDW